MKLEERVSMIQKNPKIALEKNNNMNIIRLDNKSVRKWYLSAVLRIKDSIDKTLTYEEQARQAFELRNRIRITAREMMPDDEQRTELYSVKPNITFEELIESKRAKLRRCTQNSE